MLKVHKVYKVKVLEHFRSWQSQIPLLQLLTSTVQLQKFLNGRKPAFHKLAVVFQDLMIYAV